jgi:hypothetical protein
VREALHFASQHDNFCGTQVEAGEVSVLLMTVLSLLERFMCVYVKKENFYTIIYYYEKRVL